MKMPSNALQTFAALALACFLAGGSVSNGQEPGDRNSIFADVRNGATFRFRIHPSLPLFVFRLIADKESNLIKRIDVYHDGSEKPLQTLEVEMEEPPPRNADYFQAADFNFDGYEDVQLLIMWGATGNGIYSHWLFEPKLSRFVRNAGLDEISNPFPDSQTRQLKTMWNGGGGTCTTRNYMWNEGKLFIESEESVDWVQDKNLFIKVIKKRKNGKLVVVKKEIVKGN